MTVSHPLAAVADALEVLYGHTKMDDAQRLIIEQGISANARLAALERPAPEPTEEDLPVMREAIVEHLGGSSLINVARAAYRIAARRRHIVPLPAVPQELMDRLPDEETLRIAAHCHVRGDRFRFDSDHVIAICDLLAILRGASK